MGSFVGTSIPLGVRISKYEPFGYWLSHQPTNVVEITFSRIEAILGFDLPATARTRTQWWANEASPTKHTQCRAWIDAGYETRNINLANETVVFVRASR